MRRRKSDGIAADDDSAKQNRAIDDDALPSRRHASRHHHAAAWLLPPNRRRACQMVTSDTGIGAKHQRHFSARILSLRLQTEPLAKIPKWSRLTFFPVTCHKKN